MRERNCTRNEVVAYHDKVRSRAALDQPVFGNYYKQQLTGDSFQTWVSEKEKTILFLLQEGELQRVYFLTVDLGDLGHLLARLPSGPLAMDYIYREPAANLVKTFAENQFTARATFQRIVNNSFGEMQDRRKPKIAASEHAEELIKRMPQDFDILIDHLCSVTDLKRLIDAEQVLINTVDNRITGYLIYDIANRKSLIRAWYSGERDIPMGGMLLLGVYHGALHKRNVKSSTGWVDQTNEKAITVYYRYGYVFDDRRDLIMVRS
jgi:hypothetical protein